LREGRAAMQGEIGRRKKEAGRQGKEIRQQEWDRPVKTDEQTESLPKQRRFLCSDNNGDGSSPCTPTQSHPAHLHSLLDQLTLLAFLPFLPCLQCNSCSF
jgi:hypothetical protein